MAKPETKSDLILIIDDDPNFREIFSAKLTAAGYKVEAADGGKAGVVKAKELKPRLILLDMQMPEMSGADVMVKLKGDDETKALPVVFLTNFGDPGMEATEKLMATQLGALDYFKKTEDLGELAGKVKNYFQ